MFQSQSFVDSDDFSDWFPVQSTHTDVRHTASAECLGGREGGREGGKGVRQLLKIPLGGKKLHIQKSMHTHTQLEGVHRTLTPRRALDVVREVGAWIWIRDREQGYYNKREAAISHGRIRRSTREQQSHTEEHERIRRIARGANNKK